VTDDGSKHNQKVYPPYFQTMPPRNSSFHTAGFIHIGKTGGSTISNLLRNGCNSFEEGPCRNITHETVVSKLVVRWHQCAESGLSCDRTSQTPFVVS
jgi:hypothetical protein